MLFVYLFVLVVRGILGGGFLISLRSNDYFFVIPKSADGGDSRAPTSFAVLSRPPRTPHSLPRASCANPFTHVLTQASLDEVGERRISS